tara:strand:- start:2921 stop:3205 length:285 start_codon:yes stop_codon:yes gene_type:complete
MSCVIEFPESFIKVNFCSKGNKQKILIDVLTKYSEIDIYKLASILDVSANQLQDICNGEGFLIGEPADSLAQLFIMFLGKHFFQKWTLIRSFVD